MGSKGSCGGVEMTRNDRKIRDLATIFWAAVKDVQDAGGFDDDETFRAFPEQCCGETCMLLAEFLRTNGIETIYVCGQDESTGTHAWLVVNDERINSQPQYLDVPDEVAIALYDYSGGVCSNRIDITHYEESDLIGGLIVDITGEQFKQQPVYVGYSNDFYDEYEFVAAYDHDGVYDARLINLYDRIMERL